MNIYQEMYLKLFNRITDLVEEMKSIQQETEELFLAYEEEPSDS